MEVINYVKVIFRELFQVIVALITSPDCIGQAMNSEYFWGSNFSNQAQNYFKNCVIIFWTNRTVFIKSDCDNGSVVWC